MKSARQIEPCLPVPKLLFRNCINILKDKQQVWLAHSYIMGLVLLDRNISYDCDDLILTELRSIICEDSHEIIEKLMVAVNLYVGNLLSKIEKGIFRNYKIKDIEKLSRNEELNNHLIDFVEEIKNLI